MRQFSNARDSRITRFQGSHNSNQAQRVPTLIQLQKKSSCRKRTSQFHWQHEKLGRNADSKRDLPFAHFHSLYRLQTHMGEYKLVVCDCVAIPRTRNVYSKKRCLRAAKNAGQDNPIPVIAISTYQLFRDFSGVWTIVVFAQVFAALPTVEFF